MKLWSKSFNDNAPIPGEFAFCVPDATAHVALSNNRNPDLHWEDAPAETRSFVLICHDRDVPSKGDDVNQEGREVPASLPRVDFFHWVLVDIPPGLTSIAAGSHSDGVIARGKPGPEAAGGTATAGGLRHGINDYTGWFAGDADMKGDYYGYDGPCPRGTTRCCTTTCSRCMRWTSTGCRWMARSPARRCATRSRAMCWRRPASPEPIR